MFKVHCRIEEKLKGSWRLEERFRLEVKDEQLLLEESILKRLALVVFLIVEWGGRDKLLSSQIKWRILPDYSFVFCFATQEVVVLL